MADNTNVSAFVTQELVYAIRVAVESQVLTGDGTGENFTGVLATSGILSQSFATDALTSVRKAITTLDGQNYVPGLIVLHGGDWEKIELLTATSGATDVRGVPVDPVARRLWGVPVVINNTLGAKVGLVIGEGAVMVDNSGQFETKWTDAVDDDILKNQVRCRVETRAGVSVVQPSAVAKVATAA
jgi:HK97 family phage major capsid protein